VICAKMAEPIKMLFGFQLWTLVGPRKHVLDEASIPVANGNY